MREMGWNRNVVQRIAGGNQSRWNGTMTSGKADIWPYRYQPMTNDRNRHMPLKPPKESAEDWRRAVDESWAWFTEHLGRTPHSLDVQHWLDGYVPKDAVIPPQKPELPEFMTVESRTGTSARAWCRKCDFGSNGWVSPREAFDWAYAHVAERHANP